MADLINNNNNNGGEVTEPQNEETKGKNKTQTTEISENEALFSKLDDILEKRTNGILKSVLKSNGIEDDTELKNILNEYKTSKENKVKEKDDAYEKIKAENEALKSKILDGELSAKGLEVANKLNLDTNFMPEILKLADLNEVVKDGKIDEKKLTEAITKVSERCSFFKKASSSNQSGFINIGTQKQGDNETESFEDKLRKAMGLKDK